MNQSDLNDLLAEIVHNRSTAVAPTTASNGGRINFAQRLDLVRNFRQNQRYEVYYIAKSTLFGNNANDGEIGADVLEVLQIPWNEKVREQTMWRDVIAIAPNGKAAALAESMGLWSVNPHEMRLSAAVIPPEARNWCPDEFDALVKNCEVAFDCREWEGLTWTFNDSKAWCYDVDNNTVYEMVDDRFDVSRFYDDGDKKVISGSVCPECGGDLHLFQYHPKKEGIWHVGCTDKCGWMPSQALRDVDLTEKLVSMGGEFDTWSCEVGE